jgi:hypothetical protein
LRSLFTASQIKRLLMVVLSEVLLSKKAPHNLPVRLPVDLRPPMKRRSLMLILWPSFLMAGVASAVVFALIDPLDVSLFGYFQPGREALYASGFFFFWVVGALSSMLTFYLLTRELDTQHDIGF